MPCPFVLLRKHLTAWIRTLPSMNWCWLLYSTQFRKMHRHLSLYFVLPKKHFQFPKWNQKREPTFLPSSFLSLSLLMFHLSSYCPGQLLFLFFLRLISSQYVVNIMNLHIPCHESFHFVGCTEISDSSYHPQERKDNGD